MFWSNARMFLLAVAIPAVISAASVTGYQQTNLVSDIPGMAAHTDPNLVNPWGISFGPTTPFWVSDNGAGLATLYNGTGTPQGLVVTLPNPAGGLLAPTGTVFNSTMNFNGDPFIFASEDGVIDGWRSALGTTAETLFNNSATNAVYKGLTIGTTGGFTYLYATDFRNAQITVFPGTGAPALSGNFVDPNLPAGFAPFNIQNSNGSLYVTYAKQAPGLHDDLAGPGNGFVDVFDLSGNFQKRLISAGSLNSPWGLALAPASFGKAGGALLVGNFGDGAINAFDPVTGALMGSLADLGGNSLLNDGLWSLAFGNGGTGFNPNALYLTAGLNSEANGLFARIDAVPEPSTMAFTIIGGALLLLACGRRLPGSGLR
jgi:uncharacterized protein (TIGR03118 family)